MSINAWIIIAGLLFWLLTCAALLDIARKNFGDMGKKATWAFVSMVPFLGPLLYLVFGFRRGRPKSRAVA
jgi:uncharacterized membrane protein YhaH (DUF805 family)